MLPWKLNDDDDVRVWNFIYYYEILYLCLFFIWVPLNKEQVLPRSSIKLK